MRFPLRRNGHHGSTPALAPSSAEEALAERFARLELRPLATEPASPPATPLDLLVAEADAPTPAPAAPFAPPAAPGLPFALPLKGQFTAADSRADRLIRKIRGEVEGIRTTLEQLSLENAEMMEVDIAAVLEDPAAATTLPPAALVRALVSTAEQNAQLERELKTTRSRATKLRSKLRHMQLEDTTIRARLETLEDVIAALHGNLEDFRAERDFTRHLDAPAAPQPLRAPGELPIFPALVERE